MRATLCVLLAASCVLADDERGSKRPYIADAVGNTLPPPSNGPATVGSPVNLLTPDRYEFYTFDESGELVKRLMTLEEIQAIVAAGEEAEGLVTFANDNQPTIAFNFSQPPYTKVHSVVTNVQNVLKAQMEAHKNKPQTHPTLDTPDVSDSWSLILPSIFGNTGVDIVPDKTSPSFTTPETETIEFDRINFTDDVSSKEGSNPIGSSTTHNDNIKPVSVTEKISSTTEAATEKTTTTVKPKPKSTTTTTTTAKPTTTTSKKPTTTNQKRFTSTTTTTITSKPITTTSKPKTTPNSTTRRVTTTTSKPRTTASTTVKPSTTPKSSVKPTQKLTTAKPLSTTKKHVPVSTTPKTYENLSTKVKTPIIATTSRGSSTTEKSSPIYEKVSTFLPVSTAAYITERSTLRPIQSTRPVVLDTTTKKVTNVSASKVPAPSSPVDNKKQPSVTTYKPAMTSPASTTSTSKGEELEKINTTTITTQSVSPSTTVSSTEFMSPENSEPPKADQESNAQNTDEPIVPLFDVAQSISQIASDLGNNYQPIPTTSDLLDTTNAMNIDLESKESLELDIPDSKNETVVKTDSGSQNNDNFIKISTINPHGQNTKYKPDITVNKETIQAAETVKKSTPTPEATTKAASEAAMDPILSESMDDLLSQIVNQAPQTIVKNDDFKDQKEVITTQKTPEISTVDIILNKETSSETPAKENTVKIDNTSTSATIIESTEKVLLKNKEENSIPIITSDTKNVESKENSVSEIKYEKDSEPILSSTTTAEIEKPEKIENITLSIQNSNKQNNVVIVNAPDASLKGTTSDSSNVQKPLHESVQKPSSDKININKDNVKADKISESEPKIDEFKKKIQKVNIDYKEIANERNNSWKLISTVAPPKSNEIPKDKIKSDAHGIPENADKDIVLDFSKENQGLEVTTKDLGEDVAQFTELCNELAFRYWNTMIESIPNKRSFVLSPFAITSMLAMMFMGARGATSGEMNDILKLDDMVTFNPHFTLKNISDSIETTVESGVAVSAFIRELYSDRNKGKILTFYKERAQHFYNGHVEEVNFKLISDIIRRRTNLLVKRYTWGKIIEYMKSNTITLQPPLAAFSTNIFQTDCTGSSVEGRDGEMYFVVSPNVRQRRLVPVPAALYKKGFLAGYDPVLDATAAALGNTNSVISTLFLMPGQQGNVVHAEDLEALEKRLLDSNPSTPAWNRLLRTLLPRIGLELQIPRFAHKSIFNVSSTLKKMGLKDLFDADHADLGGLNGPSKDLFLSDMIQSTSFVTCGEGVIGEQHHIEEFPESLDLTRRRRTSRWTNGWDEPRDYQRAFHDPHDVGDAMNLPLHLRPRQARLPARNAQPARLKFDRPFLFFVRHNPSGMILYVGRYNPRLLP